MVRAIVSDSVMIGHPCCSVAHCAEPFLNVKWDHFAKAINIDMVSVQWMNARIELQKDTLLAMIQHTASLKKKGNSKMQLIFKCAHSFKGHQYPIHLTKT